MSEVFVVDRSAFFSGQWPQGFVPLPEADAVAWLDTARRLGRFVPRKLAEDTPAWKQWIPYCVLRASGGPNGGAKEQRGVLCVRRSRGQSEARLHGLWSIGLGGHIEPCDAAQAADQPSGAAFFAAALDRELREELHLPGHLVGSPRFLGLLNDDASAVGQVHAGLVYAWDFNGTWRDLGATVKIAEISKMEGGFTSLVELRKLWQDPMQFETWSRFLVHAGVAGPMGEFGCEGAAPE